jgi:hypothetical protein
MKKRNKLEFKTYVGLGLVALFILTLGVAKVNAEYSFLDRIADKTAEIYAGILADKTDTEITKPLSLGAMSGPDIYSDYLNHNGVVTWSESQKMKTGTTTLCSFKNKANGTSTVLTFTYSVTGGNQAALLTVATSSNYSATTTTNEIDADRSVAASAVEGFVWTPITNQGRLESTEHLLLMVSTTSGQAQGINKVGYCKIVYQEL